MVSFALLDGECPFVKLNTNQEQSKSGESALRGFETPVYLLCSSLNKKGICDDFSFTADDEQSLLDTLILSQWEERSWKGLHCYDVTSCETKITGGNKFTAQLNEEWNSDFLKEFEKKAFHSSGGLIKPSYIKNNHEDILFCVASGEREKSTLIPLIPAPHEGILIIVNENPIEYGHIFLVPYNIHLMTQSFGRALQSISKIADEVNNSSFRVFYDCLSVTDTHQTYFQASYFGNPLPVEFFPTTAISENSAVDEIQIQQAADYPLNALVFASKNLKKLAFVVGEICSSLHLRRTLFSLLISDCGAKIYLFPQNAVLLASQIAIWIHDKLVCIPITNMLNQAHSPASGCHLHAWECCGYFVYTKSSDFDGASEAEASSKLASACLDTEAFEFLKQLCCNITAKIGC